MIWGCAATSSAVPSLPHYDAMAAQAETGVIFQGGNGGSFAISWIILSTARCRIDGCAGPAHAQAAGCAAAQDQ